MSNNAAVGGTEVRSGVSEHRVEVFPGSGTFLETGQTEGRAVSRLTEDGQTRAAARRRLVSLTGVGVDQSAQRVTNADQWHAVVSDGSRYRTASATMVPTVQC